MTKRFEITPDIFKALNRMADESQTRSHAARTLVIDLKSLKEACKREGLDSWLDERFPPQRNAPRAPVREGMRKLTPRHRLEPLYIPQTVQVKWLSRAWI